MAYTIGSAGSNQMATRPGAARNVVRDAATSRLYAAWSGGTDTYQIYFATSDDDGETWDAAAITSAGYDQLSPSLAIDGDGVISVVWFTSSSEFRGNSQGNINYRRYDGTWGAVEAVSAGDNEYIDAYPVCAVDSSGDVHVVWNGYGLGGNADCINIYYRKRASGSWQSTALVTDIDGVQQEVALCIDADDGLHLAWGSQNFGVSDETPLGAHYQIVYSHNDGSGWGGVTQITDVMQNQWAPVVAVDGEGVVHIAWSANDALIMHSVNLGAGSQISDSAWTHFHPSINVVDGQAQIVWAALGSSWSSWALFYYGPQGAGRMMVAGNELRYPSLVPDENSLAWTQGSNVVYDGIKFIGGRGWGCLLSF